MFVQIYKNRGNKYVRVVHSYRDEKTGMPKQKVLENHGRLEKLLEKDPKFLEKLEKEVAEKNKRLKEKPLDKIKNITEEMEQGLTRKNYGYFIYDEIWDQLKLNKLIKEFKTRVKFEKEEVIKELLYQRLLSPSSKKKVYENENKYYGLLKYEHNIEHYYKILSVLNKEKDRILEYLNKQIRKNNKEEVAVVFYDVTTYYFESVKKDELKAFGYSKDNKVNQVQVVMGLLIDKDGIPITYELYPGNTNEFKTFKPIILQLKEKYGINKVIVTADRGLNSGSNLKFLEENGFEYVVAAKIKGVDKQTRKAILEQEGYKGTKDFKYKKIDNEKVKTIDGVKQKIKNKLIITYSEKRAQKDRKDRERLIEKAKKYENNNSLLKQDMKKGGKKYLKIEITKMKAVLDENYIKEQAELDGYYLIEYLGNMAEKEVIDIYHTQWKMEEDFRVMKTNLEARPTFVWSENSVKGHFVICYMALVFQKYLEKILKENEIQLSTAEIQKSLRDTTIGIMETKSGDYFIKDEEPEAYKLMANIFNIKLLSLMGEVSDIKKCRCAK